MPTPAQTFEFTLDRNVHWKHLSSHECKRQEAMLEFLITESTYYQRLTILHEVRGGSGMSIFTDYVISS